MRGVWPGLALQSTNGVLVDEETETQINLILDKSLSFQYLRIGIGDPSPLYNMDIVQIREVQAHQVLQKFPASNSWSVNITFYEHGTMKRL